jgi:hypothetical protein
MPYQSTTTASAGRGSQRRLKVAMIVVGAPCCHVGVGVTVDV